MPFLPRAIPRGRDAVALFGLLIGSIGGFLWLLIGADEWWPLAAALAFGCTFLLPAIPLEQVIRVEAEEEISDKLAAHAFATKLRIAQRSAKYRELFNRLQGQLQESRAQIAALEARIALFGPKPRGERGRFLPVTPRIEAPKKPRVLPARDAATGKFLPAPKAPVEVLPPEEPVDPEPIFRDNIWRNS